jgi:hypothetical protein
MSERLTQLGQFLFRAMDLEARELGNRKRFVEQLSHVREMREETLSVCIAFSAVNQVTVKAESIVETLCFLIRLRDESLTKLLKDFQVTARYFEVRHNRTALILNRHISSRVVADYSLVISFV